MIMKKWLLVLVFLVMSLVSFGKSLFAQLTISPKSDKFVAVVDFGNGNEESYILDNDNKKKLFNSPMEAVNYLAKDGWEVVTSYIFVNGNGRLVYILKKEI